MFLTYKCTRFTNFSKGGAPGSNLKFNMQKVSNYCFALGTGKTYTLATSLIGFRF